MSSSFEDTVVNFDLDLLNSNNGAEKTIDEATLARLEKQRRAIGFIKRKITCTDKLVVRYTDTKTALATAEENLLASKEECKRICIDYRNSLDTCTKLENEIQAIRATNKQLEEKCFNIISQHEALLSHSHQLQMLVKDYEGTIETLKDSKKMVKSGTPKDFDKKLLALEKRNGTLMKHVHIFTKILLGKRKLTNKHKQLLQSYEKLSHGHTSDISHDEDSDVHDDMDQSCPMSPYSSLGSPQPNFEMPKPTEVDSESTSVDTGRGSSLAYSNNHSPEYFIGNSPEANTEHKLTVKTRSVALSPIAIDRAEIATSPVKEIVEKEKIAKRTIAVNTSPIKASKSVSVNTSPIANKTITSDVTTSPITNKTITNDVATSPRANKTITNDVTTSPITNKTITNDVATSPRANKTITNDVATSPIANKTITNDVATSPMKKKEGKQETQSETQEKECLEKNNSNNICVDANTEFEIEMILDVMRWDRMPVTPIPDTPLRPVEQANATPVIAKQFDTERTIECQGALIVREENQKMLVHIEQLAKEINFIKNTLHKNNISIEMDPDTLVNTEPMKNVTESVNHDDDSNLDAFGEYYMEEERLHLVEEQVNLGLVSLRPNVSDTNETEIVRTNSTPPNVSYTNETEIVRTNSSPPNVSYTNETEIVRTNSSPPNVSYTNETEIVRTNSTPPNVSYTNETEIVRTNSTPRMQILFEPETSCDAIEVVTRPSTEDQETTSPANSHNSGPKKKKKLSKLGKFKKMLKPKYKIKSAMPQSATIVHKTRKLDSQKSYPQKDAALLNDKAIYEKAVKVMADLRKGKANPIITSPRKIKLIDLNEVCPVNQSNNTDNQRLDVEKVTSECQKGGVNTNKSNLPKETTPKRLRKISTRSAKENNTSLSSNSTCSESPELKGFNNVQEENLSLKELQSTIKREIISPLPSIEINVDKNSEVKPGFVPIKSRRSLNQQLLNTRSIVTRSSRNSKASEKIEITSEPNNSACSKKTRANSDVPKIGSPPKVCRKRCRSFVDSDVQNKRVLRSATLQHRLSTESVTEIVISESDSDNTSNMHSKGASPATTHATHVLPELVVTLTRTSINDNNLITYNDMDMFSDNIIPEKIDTKISEEVERPEKVEESYNNPEDSIICKMIDKYGVNTVNYNKRNISEAAIKKISTKLEEDIGKIIGLSCNKSKEAMNVLVEDLQKLNYKNFVSGLMKYLGQPQRKEELFGKHSVPPAPPMTKSEQVLLYVLSQLKARWPDVDLVDVVLRNIEYALFPLSRNPEFETIETMSHFYSVVCKYFRAKSRLRMFILDAMYCMQFKAIPVVKECLDVWPHIIPLAHMGIAKTPLVTVMVYLLHFYKCDDRGKRVQEIRQILSRKYFFKVSDWNDAKILDTVRNAIKDMRDIPIEKKMLRQALIILGKRQGPRWCHKNLIKSLLQPFLENEDATENVKEFCISMIGPLMKPYPEDMKVHCEIAIDQLAGIIKQNASHRIQEATIKSMLLINRHNQHTVNQILLTTKMDISLDLEDTLRAYIRSRPLKFWKSTLARLVHT